MGMTRVVFGECWGEVEDRSGISLVGDWWWKLNFMDFDENIKNFRDTFWIVVIVALLINLVAGLLMKIFDAPFKNKYSR